MLSFSGESVSETLLTSLLMILTATALAVVLLKVNSVIFKKLQFRQKKLHLRFFENAMRALIILFCMLWALSGSQGLTRLYRLIFGSTVVLTGIIGLAGQDILKDVLAGVMLSICRPFDIGDRILLSEVDKACTVEDMTLRHVVLRTMDNIRYVIPNSEINNKVITNTSYHQKMRGSFITVPIAYTADIRKAIEVVRQVVQDCPYTFPNNPGNDDLGGYGDVYLMSFNDSSYTLETTIWTEPSMDNFLACSEIRMNIIEAFRENNIEIPYNYTNMLLKKEEKRTDYTLPTQRNISIKTDMVYVEDFRLDLHECLEKSEQFCEYNRLSDKDSKIMHLLTEELLSFTRLALNKTKVLFWIEGDQDKASLHIMTQQVFSKRKIRNLINRSNKMPAIQQLAANLTLSLNNHVEPTGWLFDSHDNTSGTNVEKAVLEAYADDIKIGMIDKKLTIIVKKAFSS